MSETENPSTSRSKRGPIIAIAVIVVVALLGAGWYFFIRDDAPSAFDIDSASEGAGDGDGDDDDSGDGDGSVEGTWTVDPDAGADSGGSSAGFRVDEELVNIGAKTVVGRTSDVDGTLTIADTTVTDAEVTVDMTTLETDDSRRDGRMKDALGTDEFETATFVLTEPIELGEIPPEGETISVTATGDLTVRDQTNSTDVTLDAQVAGDTLVVVGSSPVVFADYGVEAPTAPIVVSVDDQGSIEFQLFLTMS